MFGLGAVPGLLFLLGLAFLPESPRWLMAKGAVGSARASLRRLRVVHWDVDQEIDEMTRTIATEAGRRAGFRALFEPTVRPALPVALFFLQQLSGINAVIYYAPDIFEQAGFGSADTLMLAGPGLAARRNAVHPDPRAGDDGPVAGGDRRHLQSGRPLAALRCDAFPGTAT
jgi:hypothetical protein